MFKVRPEGTLHGHLPKKKSVAQDQGRGVIGLCCCRFSPSQQWKHLQFLLHIKGHPPSSTTKVIVIQFNCWGPLAVDWSQKGALLTLGAMARTPEFLRITVNAEICHMLMYEILLLHDSVKCHGCKSTV